jgi:CheY-like chemotaxis protein
MPAKHSVHLFHWDKDHAAFMLEKLRNAGYEVKYHTRGEGLSVRAMSNASAVVIDLSRLPSHGRAVATWLRGSKSTRHTPIIFVDGDQDKVAIAKQQLPDALYATTSRLMATLNKAIATPLVRPVVPTQMPVVPTQMMEGYASRSTAQKLGFAVGMTVRLIDPPANYTSVIGRLPENVEFTEHATCPITLWFVHDPASFKAGLAQHRALAKRSKLWVIWKKGNPAFNGSIVRETARAMGLVDYKICSVDSTWSGMLFAVKKVKAKPERNARS